MRKILIATGGTGGHIYPALFTAEELRRRGCEVVFVGVLGAAENTLRARGFACEVISARGFVSKSLKDKIMAAGSLLRALHCTARIMAKVEPDVVLGFGGYSSFPAVFLAVFQRRKTVTHEQNVLPGSANRILAWMVNKVCVGFADSRKYFPEGKALWTGTPFRPPVKGISRIEAVRKFGLDPQKKVVFVFGGSQGSRRINSCFFEMYSALTPERAPQLILAAGRNEFALYEQKYRLLARPCYVRPFIDNIDEAYAACDCVVSRAGAGTVTELAVLGVPAVLIPYPGASHHQFFNAQVLARRKGTAIIEEKFLSSGILGDKIFEVLAQQNERHTLQESMGSDFFPDPERRLVDEVLGVVSTNSSR